jgi:hypothetical protein
MVSRGTQLNGLGTSAILITAAAVASVVVLTLVWRKGTRRHPDVSSSLQLRGSMIAITGSAGFLGSIARQAALELGCDVVGIDLPKPRSDKVLATCELLILKFHASLELPQVAV